MNPIQDVKIIAHLSIFNTQITAVHVVFYKSRARLVSKLSGDNFLAVLEGTCKFLNFKDTHNGAFIINGDLQCRHESSDAVPLLVFGNLISGPWPNDVNTRGSSSSSLVACFVVSFNQSSAIIKFLA